MNGAESAPRPRHPERDRHPRHLRRLARLDLNAYLRANPLKDPGLGAVVQIQLWYRDPANTSNQSTSLSDALEFCVGQ